MLPAVGGAEAGEGAGGVADVGRDHPGPGEVDNGVAVSFVVTRRECDRDDCGAGLAKYLRSKSIWRPTRLYEEKTIVELATHLLDRSVCCSYSLTNDFHLHHSLTDSSPKTSC